MAKRKGNGMIQPTDADKSQELLPPGRERVNQGQQFDEVHRQQKNPDGTQRLDDSDLED